MAGELGVRLLDKRGKSEANAAYLRRDVDTRHTTGGLEVDSLELGVEIGGPTKERTEQRPRIHIDRTIGGA